MEQFDVLVSGAGPAGSTAALTLARAGCRVALVDKATFPRDKACGDVVGPRGVTLLAELGVRLASALTLRGMDVIGPTGNRVHLPWKPGDTFADHALAVPRRRFDAQLREAAIAAGASPRRARVAEPRDGPLTRWRLSDGSEVRADVVVGADGAMSSIARCAGLTDPSAVLWGFALRGYVPAEVSVATILMWEPEAGRALPGYGWVFPGPDGRANVGLGVGAIGDRSVGRLVHRHWRGFGEHLRRLGLVGGQLPGPAGQLGGWLRMGTLGTRPASGRVLLGRRRGRARQSPAGRRHRGGAHQRGRSGASHSRRPRDGRCAVPRRPATQVRVAPGERDHGGRAAGSATSRLGDRPVPHPPGRRSLRGGCVVAVLERPHGRSTSGPRSAAGTDGQRRDPCVHRR